MTRSRSAKRRGPQIGAASDEETRDRLNGLCVVWDCHQGEAIQHLIDIALGRRSQLSAADRAFFTAVMARRRKKRTPRGPTDD